MSPLMTCAMPTDSPATEMIYRIFSSALVAGAAAGLLTGFLQLIFVQPVLLHAELYESGNLVHFGASGDVSTYQTLPLFDVSRDVMSILFSALLFSGYAMLLLPAMLLAEDWYEQEISTRIGILWGLAGFIVFNLAPGFSMAPEVPGVAAAEVADRQVWWAITVISTGIALWLIVFRQRPLFVAFAVVLISAPHLFGAPEPDVFRGAVPPEVAAKFAARALGASMVGWIILGVFCAKLWVLAQDRLGIVR